MATSYDFAIGVVLFLTAYALFYYRLPFLTQTVVTYDFLLPAAQQFSERLIDAELTVSPLTPAVLDPTRLDQLNTSNCADWHPRVKIIVEAGAKKWECNGSVGAAPRVVIRPVHVDQIGGGQLKVMMW